MHGSIESYTIETYLHLSRRPIHEFKIPAKADYLPGNLKQQYEEMAASRTKCLEDEKILAEYNASFAARAKSIGMPAPKVEPSDISKAILSEGSIIKPSQRLFATEILCACQSSVWYKYSYTELGETSYTHAYRLALPTLSDKSAAFLAGTFSAIPDNSGLVLKITQENSWQNFYAFYKATDSDQVDYGRVCEKFAGIYISKSLKKFVAGLDAGTLFCWKLPVFQGPVKKPYTEIELTKPHDSEATIAQLNDFMAYKIKGRDVPVSVLAARPGSALVIASAAEVGRPIDKLASFPK
ncbi:MAG: hypothetical protein Q7V63_07590 [Gammaproteobacteria bacterium]|nr:hypothetical protein [Gammaproteobacteria bacterium]